jgi:hypothetical protein
VSSRGVEFEEALWAAGDRAAAVRAEWDTLPRVAHGGWILKEVRDDYYNRLDKADTEHIAALHAFWDYLDRPGAAAEEIAAKAILDSRWPWGRVDPAWPFIIRRGQS